MGQCCQRFASADVRPSSARGHVAPSSVRGHVAHWPHDAELASATYRGAAFDFSYAGQRLLAKVVDVYDGDTIRVVFRSGGGQLVQLRARMAGYDSPEMKPPLASATRDREIAAACAARDALRRAVAGSLVEVVCGPFDKYGRLLVTVYAPAAHGNLYDVNAWMVGAGHGVPYDGGRKTAFA